MKLKQRNIEEENIGDIEEQEASIDEANLGLVLSMASEQLYSNPIGSFVREITSNCVDANTESKSEEPIIITIERDLEDDVDYISFKDNGIGISPDRIKKVYMKYFSSTKRETNDEIGGWGLGSKSPLAYQDEFFITTVVKHLDRVIISDIDEDEPVYKIISEHNVKYEYLYYKSQHKPKITLLNQEITNEATGTTVKIAINNSDDAYTINKECIRQLAYFEGLYIIDKNYYYNNDFNLYDYNYFKYKSEQQPYDEMHICLGQVAYPIDWDTINRPRHFSPIAIKFDIGELNVTINREGIKYTDTDIDLINQRIELAIQEVQSIYYNQRKEIDDLIDFIDKRVNQPVIYLNEDKTHYLNPKHYNLEFEYVYTRLKEIKVPKDEDILFGFDCKELSNGRITDTSPWRRTVFTAFKNKQLYFTNETDKWHNLRIGNGYILQDKSIKNKNKLSKKDFYETACHNLGLRPEISRHDINRESLYSKLSSYNKKGYNYTLGKAKKIRRYIKHIRNYVKAFNNIYQIADETWIKEYKEEQRLNNPNRKRKAEGKLIIYENDRRKEIKLASLEKYDVVFYKLRNNEPDISFNNYIGLLDNFSGCYRTDSIKIHNQTEADKREKMYGSCNRKNFYTWKSVETKNGLRFIEVSKTNEKQLLKANTVKHISEFFTIPHLHSYLYKVKVAASLGRFREYRIKSYSSYYSEHLSIIQRFVDDYSNHYYYKFKTEIDNIKLPKKKLFINNKLVSIPKTLVYIYNGKTYDLKDSVNKVKNYLNSAEILQYISSDCPQKLLYPIIKKLKITKLNEYYYKNK